MTNKSINYLLILSLLQYGKNNGDVRSLENTKVSCWQSQLAFLSLAALKFTNLKSLICVKFHPDLSSISTSDISQQQALSDISELFVDKLIPIPFRVRLASLDQRPLTSIAWPI